DSGGNGTIGSGHDLAEHGARRLDAIHLRASVLAPSPGGHRKDQQHCRDNLFHGSTPIKNGLLRPPVAAAPILPGVDGIKRPKKAQGWLLSSDLTSMGENGSTVSPDGFCQFRWGVDSKNEGLEEETLVT